MINANFYDIAELMDENYKRDKYVTLNSYLFNKRIKNYIKVNNNLNTGDILFVGSNYENKQNYGFILIDKRYDIEWEYSDLGTKLLFENKVLKEYLSSNNIKYKNLFTTLNNHFSELIGFNNFNNQIADLYSLNNLWI